MKLSKLSYRNIVTRILIFNQVLEIQIYYYLNNKRYRI